jgi:lysophospholipase L1-like esterase
MRRWHLVGLALLAASALACEGTGAAGPAATGKPKPGMPASMAALGDSVTVGFGSCRTLLACGRNSWSTGTSSSVDSHYSRILATNPAIRGNVHNHAVPGARADDLAGQARAAVREKVQYVTILIGANDACAADADRMTPAGTFRDRIDEGLAVLKSGLPKARILVVSIPDLYRLWQLGHDNDQAVRAWGLGVCPSLLARPTSTALPDEQRRQKVKSQIDAYDRELAGACKAYGKRCRWDHGAVHDVRFSLNLVNHLDYFHPDADGQRKLAEVTYPGKFTW